MGIVHAKERHADKTMKQDNQTEKYQLEGIPARVDRVHIDGLSRTKDDYLRSTLSELFKANDFQDVILKAYEIRSKLAAIECFRNVGVYIDVSKGATATPNGLEVTFHVRELRRIIGSVNTTVGNNEGSLVVGVKCPNIFGRAERFQLEFSYGNKKSNNFNVQFVKPLLGRFNTVFTTSLYQTAAEWPWSGYRQLDRGLLIDLAFDSPFLFRHNLQFDGAIRDLSVLTRATSFAVREQSGLSLKSSLRHILSVDTRDEVVFPRGGLLLNLTTELAGFGGDVGFFKNEVNVQSNLTVVGDVVVQIAGKFGVLNEMNGDKRVTLVDQFYLGGPLTLRGFQMRGVGPHSDGNALGSDVYWGGALHVYTPLPFNPGRGIFGDLFRLHFFLNAGNVGHVKKDDVEGTLHELSRNVRTAYGLGIAARVGQVARIELNYCFPILYQRGDQLQPGVQFGIGVQFL